MSRIMTFCFGLSVLASCGGSDSTAVGDTSSGVTETGSSTTSVSTSTMSGADSSGGPPTSSGSADTQGMETRGTESSSSSDAESSSTGEAPKGDCASDNLVGCYRGMYLSLWADNTGQIVFGGETEMHRYILGDRAKENAVLDFIAEHRIESLALYNMEAMLDEDQHVPLQSFIERARDAGVLRIEAVGATSFESWDATADFHESYAPFDGFVTEIEFWNDNATPEEFFATVEYIRALPVVAPSGGPPTLSVYVGWIEQKHVDAMLPLIDRAYVHVYVDTGPQAFGYGEERFAMFAAANDAQGLNVEIWPLYSAEDHEWSAGAETFMGEWLAENGLDAAEVALLSEYEQAELVGHVAVTGHQYFSYFFLERYLP